MIRYYRLDENININEPMVFNIKHEGEKFLYVIRVKLGYPPDTAICILLTAA